MNTLENDLADARDEIARLKVQLDAKHNLIESHRDFRARVTDALAALRAEIEVVIERPYTDKMPDAQLLSKTSARHWRDRLDATIAALGLAPKENG